MCLDSDILGNLDAFLHAHIWPRYGWEEEARRKAPVFHYPKENWVKEEYQFSLVRHGEMMRRLGEKIEELNGYLA